MKGNAFFRALQSTFTIIVILVSLGISIYVFYEIFGNPENFQGKNPENNPLPGNYFGVIYKGGIIVPILMTVVLMVIIFIFERFFSISKAKGRGNLVRFIQTIKEHLNNNDFDSAIAACDKQRGSLGNVVRTGIIKYKELKADNSINKEQKVLSLQKELEEATALELPMMSKNLVILSTCASISVLIGLIGTVLGMIRAFAALAQAGAPDAVALATGISEALINTAFGIIGSTISIIFFNMFNSQIDALTFKMDEANFTIVQTFASLEK